MDSEKERNNEAEEPPHSGRSWTVAVIANVKGKCVFPADAPEDADAEFDKESTVNAIRESIESDGHRTVFLPADETLPTQIQEIKPDICFNIAEGIGSDGREAQVPGLLEMLHIPYTASRVVANAVSLNKVMTKEVWRSHHLPTAKFQQFIDADEEIDPELKYPLFAKPACEGTGMGIDDSGVVYNEKQLRCRLAFLAQTYKQPILVEEYLPGREFTVGVLGRPGAVQYSSMPHRYEADGFIRLPVSEVDITRSTSPKTYSHAAKCMDLGEETGVLVTCPAHIPDDLRDQMQTLAIRAHQAITALDVSRVDFRLDADGNPNILEINTLPGLTPDFSDLCMIANAAGLTYRDLILEILYLGASRYGLMKQESLKIPVRKEIFAYRGVTSYPLPGRVANPMAM